MVVVSSSVSCLSQSAAHVSGKHYRDVRRSALLNIANILVLATAAHGVYPTHLSRVQGYVQGIYSLKDKNSAAGQTQDFFN